MQLNPKSEQYACSMCHPKCLRGLFSTVSSLLSFDNIIKLFKLFISFLLGIYLLQGCWLVHTYSDQRKTIQTEAFRDASPRFQAEIPALQGLAARLTLRRWSNPPKFPPVWVLLTRCLLLWQSEIIALRFPNNFIYRIQKDLWFIALCSLQQHNLMTVPLSPTTANNYIMRFLKSEGVDLFQRLYKAFFFDKSKWMASFILWAQYVCCSRTLRVDWLVGSGFWLCQAPQRYPEVNRYKSLIVFTWWKKKSLSGASWLYQQSSNMVNSSYTKTFIQP